MPQFSAGPREYEQMRQHRDGYQQIAEAALDACRAVLHWYECDSSEYNRELAIKACRDAVAMPEAEWSK